jgi:outer membrane protein
MIPSPRSARYHRAAGMLALAMLAGASTHVAAQTTGAQPDSGRPATAPPVPLPLAPPKATAISADPPPLLTLDTAVALALEIGTAVQQGRFASANARSEVSRSYGGILPSVTASGLRTVTQGDPLVGARAMAPWNTQYETMGYQLQTSLNLLGGIGAYPAIRSAEYQRQTTDLTLERTRQSVALDVSQAFLQTVLDSQLVALAAQNIQVSQEQVVQLQELVRVGKRPPADLYQAQSQAAANQSLYFDAVNRQRADEISLLQRIHIDPQRSVVIATPPIDTTLLGPEWLDTAHVATEALQRRPDLQSAHAAIDATRWGIRRAANENMPALSVGFTVYSTGRVFDYATQDGVSQIATPQPALINQIGPQTSRLFSIGLGYNLYDLFRSRLDYQEAQVAYGSAQVAEGDVRRAVTGDVARAISEYGVAVQRMASTASGLASAQAAFQLVSGRYNVGFASIVDFLSAQAALAQAQSLRAQAIVQLSLAKRAIAYAIGLAPTDRLP